MVLYQIVEAVGSERRPRTGHRRRKISTRGRKLHLERVGRFLLEGRGAKQRVVVTLLRDSCRRGRWCFTLWRGCWRLGLRLFRWRRFRGLLFPFATVKQRPH